MSGSQSSKKGGGSGSETTLLLKTRFDLSKEPEEPSRPPADPLLNDLERAIRKTFLGGRPRPDLVEFKQCKTCKRPYVPHIAGPHIHQCVQKHKEKVQRKKEQKEANRKLREARDKEARQAEIEEAARLAEQDEEDEEDGDGPKRPTGSKKRKAGDEGEKGPVKKKTKKELAAELAAKDKKPAKTKGPVDVERQCGVPLPNGGFCARSLTCKSHPMGAKRAVPGRSKPYDTLLAQYQKKNQAKQQKAAIEANAEKEEDFVDPAGPVDSDEEKDLVLSAFQRWRPQPLTSFTPVPVRKRYSYIRVQDMLGQALRGSGGRIAAAAASTSGGAAAAAAAAAAATASGQNGYSGTTASNEETPEERRKSTTGPASRPAPIQTSSSRKASLASQGMSTPTAATPTIDARA